MMRGPPLCVQGLGLVVKWVLVGPYLRRVFEQQASPIWSLARSL